LTSSTKVGILPGKLVLFLIVLSNQLEALFPRMEPEQPRKGVI